MNRKNISSGTEWEKSVGYSRAVRVGDNIFVSGTTAVDEKGNIICEGDAYGQAVFIFSKIEKALHDAGAEMTDVVRTRMYVKEISVWKEVAKAHGEFFNSIRPASTLVEVSALVEPGLLVEIEADAVVTNKSER